MTNLADTLVRMKNTPDGAGNLLDNSCIYTTSCVSESTDPRSARTIRSWSSGKAGGKLKGDQHIRIVDENVSKVPFTLLKMMGGTATSWGKDEAMVSSTIARFAQRVVGSRRSSSHSLSWSWAANSTG